MKYILSIIIKLVLSAVLGSLIGFEREHKNRPAGLRTNTLVCIGSALVQIVSLDIFSKYQGLTNLDPARLGAQVISGIGFLGAGTIIREGASVKGLTTAAGLWVVACIGIAIGNGSYIPGILAAVFAYIVLRSLKGVEERMARKNSYFDIEVIMDDKPGQIGRVGQLLGDMDINIRNIEFKSDDKNKLEVFLSLKLPLNLQKQEVITKLMKEEGLYSIEELS